MVSFLLEPIPPSTSIRSLILNVSNSKLPSPGAAPEIDRPLNSRPCVFKKIFSNFSPSSIVPCATKSAAAFDVFCHFNWSKDSFVPIKSLLISMAGGASFDRLSRNFAMLVPDSMPSGKGRAIFLTNVSSTANSAFTIEDWRTIS